MGNEGSPAKVLPFLMLCMVFCLWLGFTLPGKLITQHSPTAAPTTADPDATNIILVYVDNLKSKNPKLVSVWGIFIEKQNKTITGLTFKPLYPVPDDWDMNHNFENDFELNDNKTLSSSFLQQVRSNYNFGWHNWMVIDFSALKVISNAITGMPANTTPQTAKDDDEVNSMQDEQTTLIEDICRNLTDPGALNWEKMVSSHISTDIGLGDLNQTWTDLTHQEKRPQCEFGH